MGAASASLHASATSEILSSQKCATAWRTARGPALVLGRRRRKPCRRSQSVRSPQLAALALLELLQGELELATGGDHKKGQGRPGRVGGRQGKAGRGPLQ